MGMSVKVLVWITAAIIVLAGAIYWAFSEAFGYGPFYEVDKKRSWNEVKYLPVIASIGHWDDLPFKETFPLKSNVLPLSIPKDEFLEILEENGFLTREKGGRCDVNEVGLSELKKYDTCAWRTLGPAACRYSYYVAANFEDNEMTEVVGLKSIFVCL